MIAVAWIILLGLLTLLFSNYLDKQNNPNQSPLSLNQQGRQQVVLERNRSGHYVVSGRINNSPVVFLVDTGATDVAVPEKLAERLHLQKGMANLSKTANGMARSYQTTLDNVSIGSIQLFDIRASILPGMSGDEVLLGMSFLKHLELRQKGNTLTLTQ
jgi:aspartyl protease family protein